MKRTIFKAEEAPLNHNIEKSSRITRTTTASHCRPTTGTFTKHLFGLILSFLPLMAWAGLPGIELKTDMNGNHKSHSSYTNFMALVGGQVALPCNVSAPSREANVALILWYRDDSRNPIYTVDGRGAHLEKAKHFCGDILRDRATFDISYPLAHLKIYPVKENDGGEYRCRVDFRRGRTFNHIINLNVIVPPKKIVIRDEQGKEIKDIGGPFNEDSPLNLTCESEGGNPLPSVTWWKSSKLVDNSYQTTPRGSVVNILNLPPLKRHDLMMALTCQASNNNLTIATTQTITIDVNLKPREVRIITQSTNMLASEKYELVCQSSGSRPPAILTWTKDGIPLEPGGESTLDEGSGTTNFLTFVPSLDDNGKRVSCSARNPKFSKATMEDSFILTVKFAPILSLVMGASVQHQEILEGSDVFFECNIQANPPVSEIGWLFNNEPLKSEESSRLHLSNTSLLIRKVGRIHRGVYQCWATNEVDKGRSEVVELNVRFAPICKSGQRVHYGVAKHEEAVIACEVDSDPSEVVFHWSFNSTLEEDVDTIKFVSDGRKSIATYTPRAPLDYGVLYCWAENSAGRQLDPCLFFVIPAGPPEPPDNCTLTNVTTHALTVECLPGYSGGLDQTFHLEVYINYHTNKRLINNLTSSEYPFFIANALPAGNSFHLITYASNSRGRSFLVQIKGNTLVAERWQTDYFEETVISTSIYVLIGVVTALVILAIIIILIMKIKSEDETRRVDADGEDKTAYCQVDNNTMPTSIIVPPPTCFHDGFHFPSSPCSSPIKSLNTSLSDQNRVYYIKTCGDQGNKEGEMVVLVRNGLTTGCLNSDGRQHSCFNIHHRQCCSGGGITGSNNESQGQRIITSTPENRETCLSPQMTTDIRVEMEEDFEVDVNQTMASISSSEGNQTRNKAWIVVEQGKDTSGVLTPV